MKPVSLVLWASLLTLASSSVPVWAKPRVKPAPASHKRAASPTLTVAQLARQVLPSVARLTVLDASGQPSVQGSGFVVGPNLIATNVHVIKGAHVVTANFPNGRSETVYGVVTVDGDRDLALLYADTHGLRPLPLLTDNSAQAGDPVVAVGSPEGLSGSISTGIISQIWREGGTRFLQTTAPISHGSSGGALLDMRGRVLGITSFFYKDGQNLNFAYSSYYLRQIMPHGLPIYTSWAEIEDYSRTHPAQTASAPPPAPAPPANSVPSASDAADTAKYTDKPLAGLKGVAVVVEDIRADAQADGLDGNQIKVDTELRLRKAGITVFDINSSEGNPSRARLYINVNTIQHDNLYGAAINLEVSELVRLDRDVPVLTLGSVWDTGAVATVGSEKMASALRQDVSDKVDEFINAYLAQNPK